MRAKKLERDILMWEYLQETKDMYSPPSCIEWLEDKLIELRKHAVSGEVCDNCGDGKPSICSKCYETESNFRESY